MLGKLAVLLLYISGPSKYGQQMPSGTDSTMVSDTKNIKKIVSGRAKNMQHYVYGPDCQLLMLK